MPRVSSALALCQSSPRALSFRSGAPAQCTSDSLRIKSIGTRAVARAPGGSRDARVCAVRPPLLRAPGWAISGPSMDWLTGVDLDFGLRMATALGCGGAIGLERQLRAKPVGMRTCMLICAGTMLFVRVGIELGAQFASAGDVARVVGQVVTGVGFLGAGVILTRDGLVTGMTSAAVIWMLAAIGCIVAIGHLAQALVASAVTLGVLAGVARLEQAFLSLRRGEHEEPGTEPRAQRISGAPRRPPRVGAEDADA